MRRRFWLRRALALGFLALALVLLLLFMSETCEGEKKTGAVRMLIEAGSSTDDIAGQLRTNDVIDSKSEFSGRVSELGVDQDLKPGTYIFERGEHVDGIIDKLVQGLQVPEATMTVPEGYRILEIASLVAQKTDITAQQYIDAAATTGRTLPLAGAEAAYTLEGFLFPSTYDLEPDISAEQLVNIQLDRFLQMAGGAGWNTAEAMGVTPYQALIIASMVEREARVSEERPLVAAVIYNRLAAGMKLEVDATVQYALGYWKTDLTQEDLEVDSPYNTRLYAGLPPGPITNPGIDSIRAALEPAAVDYLYYIAIGDEEGRHFFTSSYDEFVAMKER